MFPADFHSVVRNKCVSCSKEDSGEVAVLLDSDDWKLTDVAVTLVSLEELLYAEMSHIIGGAEPDPRACKQWEEQSLHHPLITHRPRQEHWPAKIN